MRRNVPCAAIASIAFAAGSATAQPIVLRNITYAYSGAQQQYFLQLDLYLPSNQGGPYPCVVWVHGGSWSGGHRNAAAEDAALLTSLGYAVMAPSYRFSQTAVWPAQMHDLKSAVRWLRAHAGQYFIDPDRFASWGDSAGGHLAAVLATSGGAAELEGTQGNPGFSSRVQACVDFFGPTRFAAMTDWHLQCTSSTSRLIGRCHWEVIWNWNNPEWAQWVHSFNTSDPTFWASNDDPPFFIMHSPVDTVVEISQSTILRDSLVAVEAPVVYGEIPGQNHTRTIEQTNLALQFLQQHIPPPEIAPIDPNGPFVGSSPPPPPPPPPPAPPAPPPPPPGPPPPPPCADCDYSGAVGLGDLALVIEGWEATVSPGLGGDANVDGVIDLKDIADIVENWEAVCGRLPPPPPPAG